MENLDPPSPPPLPKSRIGRWRVFALRAASSLIWGGGGWGFAVPFYFVQDCSSLIYLFKTNSMCLNTCYCLESYLIFSCSIDQRER